MPIVDRREFGGRFSVRENAQRLANYRYLEIQLMEMLGGWSHTTPQIAFKATFGYHVYDHAQAADLLGERLEQLRSGRESQEPPNEDFARLEAFRAGLERVPHLHYIPNGTAVDATVNSILTRFGRVDVVFANAGFGGARGWLKGEPEQWRHKCALAGGGSARRSSVRVEGFGEFAIG